jgi:hypothetical protein
VSTSFGDLLLAAVISSGVASAIAALVVRLLFDRRLTRISEEIKADFERQLLLYRSDREWRERSVAELLGPVYIHLDRSARAFRRWRAKNVFIETAIMKEGNIAVRDLLLSKAHLLPPELLEHAGKLVEHYDRWLEEFERVRGGETPDLDAPFVFVGPQGYPFPQEAERAFRACFRRMWDDLYRPG